MPCLVEVITFEDFVVETIHEILHIDLLYKCLRINIIQNSEFYPRQRNYLLF